MVGARLASPFPFVMYSSSRLPISLSLKEQTMPLYDFHAHSFFSDGELLPMELIRRAVVKGYTALAITDHALGIQH